MEALRADLEVKGAAYKLSVARKMLAVEAWHAAGYPRKGPVYEELGRVFGAHSAVHREYWDVRDRIRDLTMLQPSPAQPQSSRLPQSKAYMVLVVLGFAGNSCHPGRLPMRN